MNSNTQQLLTQSFIWCREAASGVEDLHAAFRKTFDLSFHAKQASLSVFAFDRYRLSINGRYVLRGPSRYENSEPRYDRVDVLPYLVPGRNALAILVHRDAPNGRIQSHEPGLALLLTVEGNGGERISIPTDESWKATPEKSFLSPSLLWTSASGEEDTHISHGWGSIPEVIDARLSPGAWTDEGYEDTEWPQAFFCDCSPVGGFKERAIPLLRETLCDSSAMRGGGRDLNSVLPIHLKTGDEFIVEVGHLVQAYSHLDLDADSGSRLLLSYPLPGQEEAAVAADRTSRYTACQGRQTWMGGDTFAFRKVRLRVEEGTVCLHGFRAVEVLYPFQRTGRFSCSDPDLTHLWKILARSLELLSEDAYVDCADRERVEWMDSDPPVFDATRVMMDGPGDGGRVVHSDTRLFREMLRRTALSQRENGCVKAHTCSDRWDIHAVMEDRCALWMHGVKKYYDHSGDLPFVRELWPALMRQAGWFLKQKTERGLIKCREWMCWDNPMAYQECEGTALNAFVSGAFKGLVVLGNLLDRKEDARLLEISARDLDEAMNRHLWCEEKGAYHAGFFDDETRIQPEVFFGQIKFRLKVCEGLAEPSLHANLFVLNQEVARGERAGRSQEWVLGHLGEATGVLIHHYLFEFLYGLNDERWDREVLGRMREKWRLMIASPLESSWEDFTHGSKIHAYGLVPAYFLSAYVLGVRPQGTPDKKRLLIEPRLGDLEWAEGVVTTPWGCVEVGWSKANGTFHLDTPDGLEVSLKLPHQNAKRIEIKNRAGKVIPANPGESMNTAKLTGGRYTGAWTC